MPAENTSGRHGLPQGLEVMPRDWERLVERIRRDRRSGASVLLADGIEAARLFLKAVRLLRPEALGRALERFTLRLTTSQPSMASFLTLTNALWLECDDAGLGSSAWKRLHDALLRYADRIDSNLLATVQRAAQLVRSRSLIVTYSNSTAVRLALWRAMAMGRRFEVVCSEARPMQEGVAHARWLANIGIPVFLVVDAALPEWVERADLVLLGADAIMRDVVVNKLGTDGLLRAAGHAGVPAYVLADSSKWLPDPLARFWRVRQEAPGEIARVRHPNLHVHNRYFGRSPLSLLTGVAWESGVSRPGDVQRRIAHRPVSKALGRLLARKQGHKTGRKERAGA